MLLDDDGEGADLPEVSTGTIHGPNPCDRSTARGHVRVSTILQREPTAMCPPRQQLPSAKAGEPQPD